ncbi:uncharacterized protein LOC144133446 [Amblyomma americanum]
MKITCSLLVVVAALVVGAGIGVAARKTGTIPGGIVKQPKSQYRYYRRYADALAREMSKGRENLLVVTRITELSTQVVAGVSIFITIQVAFSDCRPESMEQSKCKPLPCTVSVTPSRPILHRPSSRNLVVAQVNFTRGGRA